MTPDKSEVFSPPFTRIEKRDGGVALSEGEINCNHYCDSVSPRLNATDKRAAAALTNISVQARPKVHENFMSMHKEISNGIYIPGTGVDEVDKFTTDHAIPASCVCVAQCLVFGCFYFYFVHRLIAF